MIDMNVGLQQFEMHNLNSSKEISVNLADILRLDWLILQLTILQTQSEQLNGRVAELSPVVCGNPPAFVVSNKCVHQHRQWRTGITLKKAVI